jgi:hypothetical protein
MSRPSHAELKAAFSLVQAVGEAIRELGEVPSGELYARLCGHLDITAFERIVATLKRSGLVKETGAHMLVWIGPATDREVRS